MQVGDKIRYTGNDATNGYYGKIASIHNKYTIDLTHNADCEPLDFPQRLFDRSASELELGECP